MLFAYAAAGIKPVRNREAFFWVSNVPREILEPVLAAHPAIRTPINSVRKGNGERLDLYSFNRLGFAANRLD